MSNKKILIVDDDKDILFVLEKRLILAGYDVVSTDSGLLALTMAKSQQPDMIILDIEMPQMDGGEVARRLKADPTTAHIPVLYLTCLLSSQESTQTEHSCGGNLVLSKSADITDIIATIDKVFFNVRATSH